jgi:NADH-quinone oxidoreductase subunit L
MFFQQPMSGGPQFFDLVPWVVFFPVIGLLVNAFIGGRLLKRSVSQKSDDTGEKIVGWLASSAVGLSFIVSLLLMVSLMRYPEGRVVPLADWIDIGALQVQWSFQVDTLSVTMMLVVSGVGLLIHVYSIGYMHEDVRHNGDPGRYRRFFVFMNLFIAMMMILVGAGNYMMAFVGWEGVGLCSYLLIGFWYEKGKDGIGNAIAAKKAFIVNRVGDLGFILAALAMFWAFGSFDFHTVFARAPEIDSGIILAITLFMMVGVAGKSAQIPLYVWLPDAMAGPTPVSALIHAATMVTAGVYLVARSAELYTLAPQAQNIVAWVGAVTALFAAAIAVAQFDIKKVLAFSTISQLGFMVAAVGMGAYVAGMFHLVTHAFFKALLFLSAGSVIQGLERGRHRRDHAPGSRKKPKEQESEFDPQDMRNMGGVKDRMKVTFWVYLVGAMALAGIVPLAGFWSKDEILAEGAALHPGVFWLLILTAFLTAFYMGRQVLMIFFGKPRSSAAEHARESPPVMTVPLVILAILSTLGGVLNLPGLHTLTVWIEHTLKVHPGEFLLWVAASTTILALLAVWLAWLVYRPEKYEAFSKIPLTSRPDDPLRNWIGPLFDAMKNKFWVDESYQAVIVTPYVELTRFLADVVDGRFWHDWFHDTVIYSNYNRVTDLLAKQIDLGLIDGIANGLGTLTKRLSASLRQIQTGYVRFYALSIFLGVVIILGYLLLR